MGRLTTLLGQRQVRQPQRPPGPGRQQRHRACGERSVAGAGQQRQRRVEQQEPGGLTRLGVPVSSGRYASIWSSSSATVVGGRRHRGAGRSARSRRRSGRPAPNPAEPRRIADGAQEAVDLGDVHPAQQVRVGRRVRTAVRGRAADREVDLAHPGDHRLGVGGGGVGGGGDEVWSAAADPTDRPCNPEWAATPAMASGWRDCNSSARIPPTNIEASACTVQIGSPGANQRSPSVSQIRRAIVGPSGPATLDRKAEANVSLTLLMTMSLVCPRDCPPNGIASNTCTRQSWRRSRGRRRRPRPRTGRRCWRPCGAGWPTPAPPVPSFRRDSIREPVSFRSLRSWPPCCRAVGLPRGGTVSLVGAGRRRRRGHQPAVRPVGGPGGRLGGAGGTAGLGLLAAAEFGVDLAKLVVIPEPGPDVVQVLTLLADGIDVIAVSAPDRAACLRTAAGTAGPAPAARCGAVGGRAVAGRRPCSAYLHARVVRHRQRSRSTARPRPCRHGRRSTLGRSPCTVDPRAAVEFGRQSHCGPSRASRQRKRCALIS